MNFKPTRKKVIISIAIPFLIIVMFLVLVALSGPNCSYGGNFLNYSMKCSIFKFTYQFFGVISIYWLILSLIIYTIYSIFQKKK